jgi:hypothetical protein
MGNLCCNDILENRDDKMIELNSQLLPGYNHAYSENKNLFTVPEVFADDASQSSLKCINKPQKEYTLY